MIADTRYKLRPALDVINVNCPNPVSTQTHKLHIEIKKRKEVKPRYRIHELSGEEHFCILIHLPQMNVLTTA